MIPRLSRVLAPFSSVLMGRVAALLAAGILAACASDSPRKLSELPAIEAPVELKLQWRFAAGDGGQAVLKPATVGAIAYVAAADGRVSKLSEGVAQWEQALEVVVSGGLASDGKLLVVGTSKGEVIALDVNDGREVWRGRVSSEVLAPAAFAGETVVVRSGDHRLFGLDIKDGSRKWVMQRSTPALTLRAAAAPIVAENLVFIGYPGGKLLAVNSANGGVIWEGAVALPKGATELERMADVAGAPVLGAREVCAAAYQGRVACFDLASGNLIWAQDVSASSSVAMDNANLYVTDVDGVVRAFERTSGKPVWSQDALKWRQLSSPAVRHGLVVFGDADGFIHALQRDDGRLAGRLETDAGALNADPVAAGDLTLFQTRRGAVLAIGIN